MTHPSLSQQLLQYLSDRDEARSREAASVLACMTPRERDLVREVAVMANVRAGDHFTPPPADSVVLSSVISACLAMPDLYPTIARLARTAVRREMP